MAKVGPADTNRKLAFFYLTCFLWCRSNKRKVPSRRQHYMHGQARYVMSEGARACLVRAALAAAFREACFG